MTFLEKILAQKRREVAERVHTVPLETLMARPLYHRKTLSLERALRNVPLGIIAELKKASPSKGVIREEFDIKTLAAEYESAGAQAISVLTDAPFFQGSLAFLEQTRETVEIPLLRKDFVLDPYQIHEAKASGADAILLIVAALDDPTLESLSRVAGTLGLEVLTEVHSGEEAERAVAAGANLVGINNRDLKTFVVDLQTTEEVVRRLPSSATIVTESGIENVHDLKRMKSAGVHGALIGELFMRAPKPGEALAALAGELRKALS